MKKELMYNQLAKYTDLLYEDKDYKKEVDFILRRIKEQKITDKILVDVACGSGNHSKLLQKEGYKIYGVDLNRGMLKLAKKNIPKIKLYEQDMRMLKLPIKSDIIICMFNSINYNMGYGQLKKTLKGFYNQLNNNGLVIFDTFFTKRGWKGSLFGVKKFSNQSLEIARVFRSSTKGSIGRSEFTYVVYENGKKKILEGVNVIYIFDENKIKTLMEEVGFKTKVYYNFEDKPNDSTTCVLVSIYQYSSGIKLAFLR